MVKRKPRKNVNWVPKDPPVGTTRVWQERVEGHGNFYFHGAVVRNGERTYLVRRDVTETENSRAVCLLSEAGAVMMWYLNYSPVPPPEVQAAVERAARAAVVHSVMSA